MTTFLWVCVVYQAFELLSILFFLGIGEVPQRTRGQMAFSGALTAVVLGWCIYLLCKG